MKKYPVAHAVVKHGDYKTQPNYYTAFIGPVPRKQLDMICPNGEGKIRRAIQSAFRTQFGSEEVCSSGWGATKRQVDEASYALYEDDVKRQLIRSYYAENKPMPRALRAWELYFKECENG